MTFDLVESERNRRERKFSFGYTARVFLGFHTVEPAEVVESEANMKALGEVDGELFAVMFIHRDSALRIISARPANRKECEEWQSTE